MEPLVIATVVVVALVVVADMVLRRSVSGRVEALYYAGQHDQLLTFLDGRLAAHALDPFQRQSARFQALLGKGDVSGAERALDALMALRLSGAQRADVLVKAFSYYLGRGAKSKVERILALIEAECPQEAHAHCTMLKEIEFDGSYAHIQTMEAELTQARGIKRLELLHLLSKQCQNKGDKEGARRYQELLSA